MLTVYAQLKRFAFIFHKVEIDALVPSLVAERNVFVLTKTFEDHTEVSKILRWQDTSIRSECAKFFTLLEAYPS